MAGKIGKISAVARPWGEHWQLWKHRKKIGGWDLEPLTVPGSVPPETLSAVPARLAVAVSFWVDAVEPETVRSIALLEVEMKGLATAERLANDVFITILWAEDERTLVRAIVLPPDPRVQSELPLGESYEPSPLVMALSGNTVHLWRELDDLVAVVVWKDQVLCWETQHWPASAAETRTWLRCFILQLRSELKLNSPLMLKEWTPVFDQPPAEFSRDEVISESDRNEGPVVALPANPTGWLPLSAKLQHRSRRRKELFSAIGVGVALLIVLTAITAFFLQWRIGQKIAAREAELAAMELEIAPLRNAAMKWSAVEAAADDRFFPIEMLHLIVSAMPAQGVKLTAFEMSPTQILIEGEATQVSAAAEYFQKIQEGDAGQIGVTWNMPPATLQANNTAKFVINGSRANGQ